MTIAERIRLIRQQKNLSQKELAQLADVNLKSLSRYELGTTVPPADSLGRIAKVLGASNDYFIIGNTVEIQDLKLYERFLAIQAIEGDTKKMILHFLDMAIRDAKAKEAYQ
jgi:transcriptional regulator with XRE-family HTH domain